MKEIGSERFRQVLGHMPTSVAIITAHSAEGPTGLVVSTVNSVSLEPPLVSFCVRQSSRAWSDINGEGEMVGVNILAFDQEATYQKMTRQSSNRLSNEVDWTVDDSGLPQISNALAWMVCRIDRVQPIGDHDLVIAEVDSLTLLRDSDPMLSSVAAIRSSYWEE